MFASRRAVRELRRELGYRALLQELSPELRGMLTLHCYGPAVTSVPFFRVSIKHLSHRESMDASAESNGFLQNVSQTPCAVYGVLSVCWLVKSQYLSLPQRGGVLT